MSQHSSVAKIMSQMKIWFDQINVGSAFLSRCGRKGNFLYVLYFNFWSLFSTWVLKKDVLICWSRKRKREINVSSILLNFYLQHNGLIILRWRVCILSPLALCKRKDSLMLGTMIFSISTFSITTFSIMNFFVTLSIMPILLDGEARHIKMEGLYLVTASTGQEEDSPILGTMTFSISTSSTTFGIMNFIATFCIMTILLEWEAKWCELFNQKITYISNEILLDTNGSQYNNI